MIRNCTSISKGKLNTKLFTPDTVIQSYIYLSRRFTLRKRISKIGPFVLSCFRHQGTNLVEKNKTGKELIEKTLVKLRNKPQRKTLKTRWVKWSTHGDSGLWSLPRQRCGRLIRNGGKGGGRSTSPRIQNTEIQKTDGSVRFGFLIHAAFRDNERCTYSEFSSASWKRADPGQKFLRPARQVAAPRD